MKICNTVTGTTEKIKETGCRKLLFCNGTVRQDIQIKTCPAVFL